LKLNQMWVDFNVIITQLRCAVEVLSYAGMWSGMRRKVMMNCSVPLRCKVTMNCRKA